MDAIIPPQCFGRGARNGGRKAPAWRLTALLLAVVLGQCCPGYAVAQSLRFINYTTANGLGNNSVTDVYASGSTVYAATQGGLSISTNSGTSFTNYTTTNGLGHNAVQGVYASGSNVYAATYGGLSISTNSGTSFTNRTTTNGLGNNTVNGVYASGSTVYAATMNGLSISTNSGTSFTNRTTTNGLGSNRVSEVYASGSTVYATALAQTEPFYPYYQTGGGLGISTDGGNSFTNSTKTNGLGNNDVYDVFASGSTVYAATYEYRLPFGGTLVGVGGLSISNDGGSIFTNYSVRNGLGSNNVRGVFVSGSTVYAATSGGLSISASGSLALAWSATSATWNGSNADWVPNGAGTTVFMPGDSVTFSGTAGGTVTLSGTLAPASIAVSATSGTYTFDGSAGNLITGSTGLTKSGGGTLVLSGSNAYSGTTVLSAGTIRAGDDSALGTGQLALNGGTFAASDSTARTFANAITLGGDVALGDASGTGAVTFSGNVELAGGIRTLTTAADVTVSGTIGNGSLTKTGAGTLTLTGNNTYTGTTTVATGTLSIGSGGTTGSVAGNIANSAAVQFNRSNAITYSGTISGTGALIKSAAGTLTLTGNHTYTGTTAVAAGKLLVNGALASSTTSISAAAVLGGSGTISGAVVVGNTGTLSPGNSPGILSVNSLSLSGSAFTLMEIVGSGSTAGVAGTAYDQVAITTANGLSFGGTLDLDFGGRTTLFQQGTTFQLFSFSGTTAGDFTTIRTIDASGSYAGLTFSASPFVAGEWTTGIVAGSGNQYLMFSENTGRLVALPEPSAVAMAALGAGLAGWRLRRGRQVRGRQAAEANVA